MTETLSLFHSEYEKGSQQKLIIVDTLTMGRALFSNSVDVYGKEDKADPDSRSDSVKKVRSVSWRGVFADSEPEVSRN